MSEETQKTTATEAETIITEPSPSPLEQELARENKRNEGRSEAEKAAFSLKKNAERVKELGLDPNEILGIKTETQTAPKLDKDVPLTVGMYEQMQKQNAQKTAIELADNINDVHERELVKKYIENRIVPSGNPEEDLRIARMLANAAKNSQIIEEVNRSVAPKAFNSGAGAPPKSVAQTEPELTAEEKLFTRAPLNMTPAEIIALRSK